MSTTKKCMGAVFICLLLFIFVFACVKIYKKSNAKDIVGKCYNASNLIVYRVVRWDMGRYDADGVYTIEGVYAFFLPFEKKVPQSEFESELLPISKEMPCPKDE